jgi:hypothetical protein
VSGPHPDDLPGTGSKTGACGVSGRIFDRSHAPRGNAATDALRQRGRRASSKAFPRGAWERSIPLLTVGARLPAICRAPAARPVRAGCQAEFLIVPTLRVVTQRLTFCVNGDAERPQKHSHAERGSDQFHFSLQERACPRSAGHRQQDLRMRGIRQNRVV